MYANSLDIHMTSNSWGGGPFSQGLKDAIELGDKLFIAAAGNFALNTDINPFYPASYDSENIILRKKLSKKTIKLHTCGKCHMPLKEIYNKRHLKIIKEIEKLEKKLK